MPPGALPLATTTLTFSARARRLRDRGLGESGPHLDPLSETPSGPLRPRRPLWRRVLAWLVVLGVIGVLCAGVGAFLIVQHFSRDLPSFDSLQDYRPEVLSRLLGRDGEPIAELYRTRRTVVPLEEVPEVLVRAVVAAEDDQFFHHEGLDYFGILRAMIANLRHGRVVQGGSTITQQVLKNFLLKAEGRWARKFRELLLARRLETELTKYDLLYLYLNQIYFGHGCHGIGEAARFYFGKAALDLDIAEAAILAGVLNGPAIYSPLRHPARARRRQRYVIASLEKRGYIDAAAARDALAQKVELKPAGRLFNEVAPYYAEHVRRELADRYGNDAIYAEGLTVRTAVDPKAQAAARAALRKGLEAIDRRQGFRGPLMKLKPEGTKATLAALKRRLTAANEERERRAREAAAANYVGAPFDTSRPLLWDLGGVELKAWESGPAAVAKKAKIRRLEPGERYAGFVIEADAKSATVDLGGALATLDPKAVAWARKRGRKPKKVSDVLTAGAVVFVRIPANFEVPPASDAPLTLAAELDQPPKVQGAVVAIDPRSREVLAMVGGYAFAQSALNRAVQSQRQPGSSFKPIVYATAVQTRRYTGATRVLDAPFSYEDPWSGKVWQPMNFDGRYRGDMTLRQALTRSINTVSVRLANDVGPEAVVKMARRFGIRSELYAGLPLALGSSAVTPLEIVNAYAVLASGGMLADPVFVHEVRDRDGRRLEADVTQPTRAIHPAVAYIVTDLLRSVVNEGTGRAVKRLGRPIAGKTGTTNDHRDAWFVGYTPQLAAAVWVGHDTPKPMGRRETGGYAAAPIWRDFVAEALKDAPVLPFDEPDELEMVSIAEPPLPTPMDGEAIETWLLERPTPTAAPSYRFEPMLPGTEPEPTPDADIEAAEAAAENELDARLDALLEKMRQKAAGASASPAPSPSPTP